MVHFIQLPAKGQANGSQQNCPSVYLAIVLPLCSPEPWAHCGAAEQNKVTHLKGYCCVNFAECLPTYYQSPLSAWKKNTSLSKHKQNILPLDHPIKLINWCIWQFVSCHCRCLPVAIPPAQCFCITQIISNWVLDNYYFEKCCINTFYLHSSASYSTHACNTTLQVWVICF